MTHDLPFPFFLWSDYLVVKTTNPRLQQLNGHRLWASHTVCPALVSQRHQQLGQGLGYKLRYPLPKAKLPFPTTVPRMTVTPVEPKAGPPSTLYQGKKKKDYFNFCSYNEAAKENGGLRYSWIQALGLHPRSSDSSQCLSPDFASALSGVRQGAGPLGGRMAASSPRKKDIFPPKSLARIVLPVPGAISVAPNGVELPG